MTKEFTEVCLIAVMDGDRERLMFMPADLQNAFPGLTPFIPRNSVDPSPVTDELLKAAAQDIAKFTGETVKIIRFVRQDIIAHGWPGTVH